jgi:hypothetical protein
MNLHFQDLIPEDFNDNSRVWIYQCNRVFILEEVLRIEELLEQFCESWNSHGAKVKGYANLFFGQFIIFMADETAAGVSGCSTDSSVRIVKNIEQDFNVTLFDRQTLAFATHERIQLIPMEQLNDVIENNFINTDTLYFNNTVQTKNELLNNWIIPAKQSWLNKKYEFAIKSGMQD